MITLYNWGKKEKKTAQNEQKLEGGGLKHHKTKFHSCPPGRGT